MNQAHGAADLLLLRRGHRHFHRGKGRSLETVAQMSARTRQHARGDQRHAVPRHEHQARGPGGAKIPLDGRKTSPTSTGRLFSGGDEVPRFTKIARSTCCTSVGIWLDQDQPGHLRLDDPGRRRGPRNAATWDTLHQRPKHPEGAEPAVPRRPAAKLEEAGDNARMLLNLRKRVTKIGLRPGLRVGQFPGHRLQGKRRHRGRDQPAARRTGSRIRNPGHQLSMVLSCATSWLRSPAWRWSSPNTSAMSVSGSQPC